MRRPVSPFMESVSRSVQTHGHFIFHNGKLDLITDSVFREPLQMIPGLQVFHHGFLNDLLAVRNGKQRGVETVSLYRKLGVGGKKLFPRECLSLFKKLIKGRGAETSQLHQHPFSDTETDIGSRQGRSVSPEIDSSVFRTDLLLFHMFQFRCDRTFQPQKTRNTELIFHRTSTLLSPVIRRIFTFKYILCVTVSFCQ